MNKGRAFTLVELMIVVAIIAILAAVALPMYTTFKQKAVVSNVLRTVKGVEAPLLAYFQNYANFTSHDITLDGPTGKMHYTQDGIQVNIGGTLVAIPHMAWTIQEITDTELTLAFNFESGAGCPPAICDGTWTLICDPLGSAPVIRIVIGDGSLGLNVDP